ncbi:hypothetical protein ACQPXB_03105 [Amycolatopsis sp. CA-161197]|uniref:hypothetical protein n=1 Tax=Amycolatopsis sp. CA-161197 TaxID=3239922 RepID=UPI003D8F7503
MAGHWYWYVVLALVVGGYGVWYLRGYRRRTAAIAAGARERGWTYRERAPQLLGRCHGYPFGRGRRPRAWHAVSGSHDGREFTSFEYSEVVGHSDVDSNDSAERLYLQVYAVKVAGAPVLTVRRRGVAGVVAGRLGVGGNATGDPDFDRRFVVEGDATSLTPEAQVWLTAHPRPFRVDGGEVLVWDEGRFDLGRVEPALEQLGELLTRARLG